MKISASDWAVISTHFDRLADLSPGQRRSELASLALEEKYRQQLEHLLEQHERADSLGLDTGAPQRLGLDRIDDAATAATVPDWQGQTLGPWQVDEVIGRGGMSVIYRGHRADGRFEKDVAIKVLNRAQLVGDGSRLGEETRILARLEHPGIARLIDSGTSEAGHGYLVMELIHGEPLDAYCRSRDLSALEIVGLVVEAAGALEYAHQRQVVHCDIKPANLLVRDNGRLCVVDFGIAALLQRQPDGGRHLYCSPAYTAPERFQRAPPDTSQDVYSLGAVLGKLVPSRTHDLDAVCSRATARDPGQRYPSMSALRDDLEAWRDKRPVQARDGGRIYVLSRWLQRHALAATLGLFLIVSLAGGTAIAVWQAREATREAERAIAARDFLIGIFEAADPALSRGEDPTASQLLRRGAERVQSAMAGQPELLAEVLHVIGRTQLERGLIDDASDSLDQVLTLTRRHDMKAQHTSALSDRGMAAYERGSYNEAVDLLEQARVLARAGHASPDERDRIEVRLADMLVVNRDPGRALEVVEPLLERLGDVTTGTFASIRVDAQRVQGAALQEDGRLERAQEVLEEALDLQQRLDDNDILLAKIENDLGIVYWYQKNFDAAARVFTRSLEHKLTVYGEDHPQTISTLGNLAGVNMARGDHAGAESAWLQSIRSLRRVHEGSHPDIAYTWGMLAWSHYMRDDFDAALEHVEKGLDHRETLPDRNPRMVAWLAPLRGLVLLEMGRPVSVEDLQQSSSACESFDDRASLQQRLCLAHRLLATDPPATCEPEMLPPATSAALLDLPARWRAVHSLLELRCADAAKPAAGDLDLQSLPAWLGNRISGK